MLFCKLDLELIQLGMLFFRMVLKIDPVYVVLRTGSGVGPNLRFIFAVWIGSVTQFGMLLFCRLTRMCDKDVQLAGGYHVAKNMEVFIPAYGIHMDPELWPDPEIFDPERCVCVCVCLCVCMPEREREREYVHF